MTISLCSKLSILYTSIIILIRLMLLFVFSTSVCFGIAHYPCIKTYL